MCVVILAWHVHPRYPLVLISNRDEYYQRETLTAAPWNDNIIGGKDGDFGGTWLGVTRDGRIAVVTNYREKEESDEIQPESRGFLTTHFLQSNNKSPEEYLNSIQGENYRGFSLIVGHVKESLWWKSNRVDGVHRIKPGVYGLSNRRFDDPWPKVVHAKHAVESLLANKDVNEEILVQELFSILANRQQPSDAELPDTGVGLEWERLLSPMFVAANKFAYGTRASTVILFRNDDQVLFVERSFGSDQKVTGQVQHCFCVQDET